MTPVAAERLEVRQVMTVTSPISLSTATANAAAAQLALDLAHDNFVSTMTTLETTLNSDFNYHAIVANGLVASAEGLFGTNVASINNWSSQSVGGLTNGFNGQVDTFQTALEGAIAAAQGAYQSAIAGPQGMYDAAVLGAQTFFDGQLSLANGVLDGVISGLQTTLDGTVATQTATSLGNIAGFNAAFDAFANGQQVLYDGQELSAWNSYLTTVDSSATGLQGIFNAAIASAATIRDSILTTYPNVVYNPEILQGTSAYDTLTTGANVALNTALTSARNTFESSVQTDEATFTNAVYGPTGATATLNSDIAAADDALQTRIDTASTNYRAIVDPARLVYENTVNGPGGLQQTFETNVTALANTYYGAVQAAQSLWQGAIDTAQTNYDGAVQTAQQNYVNWQTGNVFDVAKQLLTALTNQTITGLGNGLASTISDLKTTLQGQIATANATYNSQMNDPLTGIDTLFGDATFAAWTTAGINTDNLFTDYQNTVAPLTASLVMASMFSGGPPNMTPVYQATQDYSLEVIAQEITYTDTVGSALISHVTAERAADTARDVAIVNDINSYLEQAINAVDTFQANAMVAFRSWLNGMTNLEAGYQTQDASEVATLGTSINNASQTFGLAKNTADEQFATAESNAALARAQGVAAQVESFRNNETTARVAFLQAEAPAARTFDSDVASAIGDGSGRMVAGANAANQYAITATNAAELLQNSLLGNLTAYTTAMVSAVQGWGTTVSNGVAAQWSALMGGGADVTAVANAWSAFDQAAALAWGNFANGEAGAFQGYGAFEAGASKTAQQNNAAQNITRVTSIGGEVVAYDAVVGGALLTARQGANVAQIPWMTTVAAGERSATNQLSTAGNAFELAAAPLVHTAQDSGVNAQHAFVANVFGAWTPYSQSVTTQEQFAQISRITAYNTLMTSTRTARTSQAQFDRDSWRIYANSAGAADDPLINAVAKNETAKGVLSAVTRFTNSAALAPADFSGAVSQRQAFQNVEGGFLASLHMNDNTATAISGVPATESNPAIKPGNTVERFPFETQAISPRSLQFAATAFAALDQTAPVPNPAQAGLAKAIVMAQLSDAAYPKGRLPDGLFTAGWRRVPRPDLVINKIGFHAALFQNANGQVVLAFAGTQIFSPKDWRENRRQAAGLTSKQYETAIALALQFRAQYGDNLHFTGHSLGGGLASVAAIACGGDLTATTFNAAGVHKKTLERFGFSVEEANSIISAYRVFGDPLSVIQAKVIDPLDWIPNNTGRTIELKPRLGEVNPHSMAAVLDALRGIP